MGAADDVLAHARSHLCESRPVKGADGGCATFVSDVFKEAGLAWAFIPSSGVAQIVMQFTGAKMSTSLANARPADLIVFGDDEHVAIYSGNGMCVGTGGWSGGGGGGCPDAGNRVRETPVSDVTTNNHPAPPSFSKVLFTTPYLDKVVTDPMSGVGKVVTDAIASMFGTLFAWVPGFALNAGILLLAAALVFVGLREVVSDEG